MRINNNVGIDGKDIEWPVEEKLMGGAPWRIIGAVYATNDLPALSGLVEKYKNNKIEIALKISLAPIFLENRKFPFYEKKYEWNSPQENWIETQWGVADELHEVILTRLLFAKAQEERRRTDR